MPCLRYGNAIICTRAKRERCYVCGAPTTLLCDWKLPNGKTCDRPICRLHSVHKDPDTDYCHTHPEPQPAQEALF